MRPLLAILLVILLAGLAAAQTVALPMKQSPQVTSSGYSYNITTLSNAVLSVTFDYVFTDTTARIFRTNFGGAPVTFCWTPNVVTGWTADSISITIDYFTWYDYANNAYGLSDTDEAGTDLTVTVWSIYDWTDARKYMFDIPLNYPCWGMRVTFTSNKLDTSGSFTINHHIIYQ